MPGYWLLAVLPCFFTKSPDQLEISITETFSYYSEECTCCALQISNNVSVRLREQEVVQEGMQRTYLRNRDS